MEYASLSAWVSRMRRPLVVGSAAAMTVGLCTASTVQASTAAAAPRGASAVLVASSSCATRLLPIAVPASGITALKVPKGVAVPAKIRALAPGHLPRALPALRCLVLRAPFACAVPAAALHLLKLPPMRAAKAVPLPAFAPPSRIAKVIPARLRPCVGKVPALHCPVAFAIPAKVPFAVPAKVRTQITRLPKAMPAIIRDLPVAVPACAVAPALRCVLHAASPSKIKLAPSAPLARFCVGPVQPAQPRK